jgi:hypothetical protein
MIKLTAVGEGEEVEGDTEDTGVVPAVDAVGVDCVATGVVAVEGSAPAPLTGWGPVKPPSWGAGARFLRKRLWLTWWFGSNAFASEVITKERTSVM